MHKLLQTTLVGTILLFTCICELPAQTTIYYQYDNAGNRNLRTITLLKSARVNSSDSTTMDQKPGMFTDSLDNKKILLFPNPTRGNITIKFESYQEDASSRVYLYGISGNSLMNEPVTSTSINIDLSGYPAGIYILKITLSGKTTQWKVIKE